MSAIKKHNSLREIRERLNNGQLSAEALTKQALKKAEENRSLNCFTELWQDEALKQALVADKEIKAGKTKPLLGVPVAIKDNIATILGKTTCASRMLKNYSSPFDATAVKKLTEAGAVIIGKTNLDEFGMGSSNENSVFGAGKNPWDPERTPGGSSGGSAAAVAADIVPVALGSDTGGSVRQPAAYCNLTGLKPTYGRVSRYGLVAYASSLDQIGVLAKSAEDCAETLSVISGWDPLDSTSINKAPFGYSKLNLDLNGFRVGIPKSFMGAGLSETVKSQVENSLAQLEKLGASLVEIELSHVEAAIAAYYILAPAEASSNLARYDGVRYGYRTQNCSDLKELYHNSRSEGFGKEVKRRILVGTYVLSSGYYDAYYLKAQKVKNLIIKDFLSAFKEKCDIIAGPTTPTPAFKLGEHQNDPIKMYLNDIYTVPVNLAGLPAISIPCGFIESGLPVGLQLIGKPWDEENLFKVAVAYQNETAWHLKRPDDKAEVL